jgi:CheY-like chemotaxis protein
MRFFQVGSDTSDHTWAESITSGTNIQQNKSLKGKILVVDDVVELLDMYQTMFQLKGYEVETAKNGLEGITKAASFKPKYILLDIMMPHMDGFELMKAFYNNTSLESVIIVNSNIDGAASIERIYSSGADYYIRKSDYVPSQIIMMIEKGLFDKKRDKSLPVENKSFTTEKDFFV